MTGISEQRQRTSDDREVREPARNDSASGRSPIRVFVRASSLHFSAAAAAAALREELVQDRHVEPYDVDAAYAVSRLTPGTNFLALFALLGHRIGGWPLA